VRNRFNGSPEELCEARATERRIVERSCSTESIILLGCENSSKVIIRADSSDVYNLRHEEQADPKIIRNMNFDS
jgi:hypothetical protein